MEKLCPFCQVSLNRIIFADQKLYALWDDYPVSPGHALIVPRRHITDWFHATDEIRHLLISAIKDVQARNRKDPPAPMGITSGSMRGRQQVRRVDHLHIHVIPRYRGDVTDPRGGVRYVIPEKANYLIKEEATRYAEKVALPDLSSPQARKILYYPTFEKILIGPSCGHRSGLYPIEWTRARL